MVTPLYKFLKENGTSFYAFPGAAEDISAAFQNSNYKMYFSHYALLHLPAQNLVDPGGTMSEYITWDFTKFETLAATQPSTFAEQVIESLRNYVANHEVTLRESRQNNTDYYYNVNSLKTTTEKIFFKWCKKIGIMSFEPALPKDEYFDDNVEFERLVTEDDSYFPEYLWKERSQQEYKVKSIKGSMTYGNRQVVHLTAIGYTNFRIGDIITISNISASNLLYEAIWGPGTTSWLGDINVRILEVNKDNSDNDVLTLDLDATENEIVQQNATVKLVYHKVIRYIGNINGVSNVQEANKAYTEVYAHVPDHTGETPDILFRTMTDDNYQPGLFFPIIPNQYQPEIVGAELFSSPIVNTPQNYPGSYYGQFDNVDFNYETSNGDTERRSGDYFGVDGNINSPLVNGDTIDGISIDFDTAHYVKMNIQDRTLTNFDQFNALEVNSQPPKDFEFNAILWYYTVEDQNANQEINLYGVSFLDNPDNNPKESEKGIKFPTYKKLVTNGKQDGTSYQFMMNLNFNIINDNPIEAYNPSSINSLFSMGLFNEAMSRLASANDSFINIISNHTALREEIMKIKQLLYTQKDFDTINSKISNLESLLNLYSTSQLVSSDTIEVVTNSGVAQPFTLALNSTDKNYIKVDEFGIKQFYSNTGDINPLTSVVPSNKDYLIHIFNNDNINLKIKNGNNLKLLINQDLIYRQSVDIVITGTLDSTENKKLDIFMSTTATEAATGNAGVAAGPPVERKLIGDIDLPVFYNNTTKQLNCAKKWKKFNFDIDLSKDISVLTGNRLELYLNANSKIVSNSLKKEDPLVIENLFVGTSSIVDLSGQYKINDVGTQSNVKFDISNNSLITSYVAGQTLPYKLHSAATTLLSNNPFIELNKGKLIRITRISTLDVIPLNEKYLIDIKDIEY